MKQNYFIKFDRRINQIIGCQRATLILSTLEYWFKKKPDGFYKFIEACSHRLYKEGDSWTEQLDCDPKSFSTSFKKIGTKYKSRSAFEAAEDKFQGKMYASFYDRYTNQTFFVRNNELVNEMLASILSRKKVVVKEGEGALSKITPSPISKPTESLNNLPIRIGKNSRSYIEAKNTSNNLSKDKSHAEEIVKKMIEIWTAVVEDSLVNRGKNQIELTGKRIAFLKRAFVDKFDSCLEKWKKYCQDIASSRFLMGDVKDFRATLDWVLRFENIQKIFEGQYGIGDRALKVDLPSQTILEEEISSSCESQRVKDFRVLCLRTVGQAKYISYFKNLRIEFRGEGGIVLLANQAFTANLLEQNCYSYLRVILQSSGNSMTNITILAPGEERGRLIQLERGGDNTLDTPVRGQNSLEVSEEGLLQSDLMSEFKRAVDSLKGLGVSQNTEFLYG